LSLSAILPGWPSLVAVDGGLLGDQKAMSRVRRALREVLLGNRPSGLQVLVLLHNLQEEIDFTERAGFFARLSRESGVKTAHTRVRSRAEDPRAMMGFYAAYCSPRPQGRGVAAKVDMGKRILHLARRGSPFISRYSPPRGVVCHQFLKGAIATGCPFDCSYCYLQLTLRLRPAVTVYLNLEDMFAEFPRWEEEAASKGQLLLLNLGELADAVEPFPWLAGEVCRAVRPFEHLGVLLLTKSPRLSEVPHLHDRVVCAVSLTNPELSFALEAGTPSPLARLRALERVAEESPARIRARLDPVIFDTGQLHTSRGAWQYSGVVQNGAYFHLIKQLAGLGPRLELLTLGQLRFSPPLLRIAAERHPGLAAQAFSEGGVIEGQKVRRPQEERLLRYHLVGDLLDEAGIAWGVCKETPELVKGLRAHALFQPGLCNCIWH